MWKKGKIINDDTIISVKEGGVYKLKGRIDSTLTTSTINPCELWHKILVHVNYKALPIVIKVVTCLLEIHINNEGVWKGCAQGKNTNSPFPTSNSKAKGILEIVHSYVYGPMSNTSLRGYVYFVSFIDDFSQNIWIYFLKKKDEVFERFKEFKAPIENLSEKKIKILKSDNRV